MVPDLHGLDKRLDQSKDNNTFSVITVSNDQAPNEENRLRMGGIGGRTGLA